MNSSKFIHFPDDAAPQFVNPLSPDIKMHILLTVLHTFLMELERRICQNVKSSYPW